MIEETLLGGHLEQKELASRLFHLTIEESRQKLLPWIQHPAFSPYVFMELCKSNPTIRVEQYLENPFPINVSSNLPPAWTPQRRILGDFHKYSYWCTVFLRVNCVKHMGFANAHLEAVKILDSMEDPSDEALGESLQGKYRPLGPTQSDRDRNLIATETRQVCLRETPLVILKREYPDLCWTYEEAAGNEEWGGLPPHFSFPSLNPVYRTCRFLMNQCATLFPQAKSIEVRDALWFYHGCFLDYICNFKEDEHWMPLELYPFDTRCFTAYDLPNAFHLLSSAGMVSEDSSILLKFMQKSLPFAGARRTLITQTVKSLSSHWNLFSSLFYCMLLDMYPGREERNFDLDRLIRARELACNLQQLTAALNRTDLSAKENDKGCYIVFTAFRLWMCMMAHNQKHFQEGVIIDWESFAQQTDEMARIIGSSDIFNRADPFGEARELLSRSSKNPKIKVYRYKPISCIETILEKMMLILEKDIYKTQMDVMNTTQRVKENILNALIHAPREEWLNPVTVSMLLHPRFGGVRRTTVESILKLVESHERSTKPQVFDNILKRQLHAADFNVVCWYFHVLSILNKVEFRPLSSSHMNQVDWAMAHVRFKLFPGQSLPLEAYNVFFSICCGKIKTLTGSSVYGHKNMAFDANRNYFICSKAQKRVEQDFVAYEEEDDDDPEEVLDNKTARKQRKRFNLLPCGNNPVFPVSLRGFMLIYDKSHYYTHCPSCGGFHEFSWSGYRGLNADYQCIPCKEKRYKPYTTCTVCGVEATLQGMVEDPLGKPVFQLSYFCKKHYNQRFSKP